jgi:adenylate cyclase
LISQSLFEELRNTSPNSGLNFRLLDTVAVKGKTKGVRIFTVKKTLSPSEQKAWPIHNQGMKLYYKRSFNEAARMFKEALSILGSDFNAENLYNRCNDYASNPPPEDWNGVEIMKSK